MLSYHSSNSGSSYRKLESQHHPQTST
uniref:Uncharacterized protein n=1 Tax=Rhizophora mucronata TaxID=61149 RepID=A0A2P2QYV0_RHIMU